jgi:hypothetical protein
MNLPDKPLRKEPPKQTDINTYLRKMVFCGTDSNALGWGWKASFNGIGGGGIIIVVVVIITISSSSSSISSVVAVMEVVIV